MVSRFLLCLLVGSALAGSLQEAEVPRDWTSQYQQSRTSWRGIRIHVYYNDTLVDSSAMNSLKTDVMPRVLRWYEHVLQVPPISTTIKVPSKYCVQSLVPTSHNVTGVEADMVLYVVTSPSWSYYINGRSIYGAPCLVSGSAPQRVLAGGMVLKMDWFNQLSLEIQIQVVAQAVAQTLAFNGVLYPYFSKPDGSPYHLTEVLKFETLGGVGAYFMILPTVLKRARAAFACPTLPGVRFGEYSSSNEYFASVWSARMMMDDFMSNKVVNRPSYSDVTMAVFEDSGWYEVQWEYTNPVQFLYHQGCEAFSTSCISNGAATRKEFCVGSGNGCGASRSTIGFCSVATYSSSIPAPFAYFTDQKQGGDREMDYCPVISGYQTCLEGSAGVSGEEKCSECRCLTGTYQSTLTHCFRITCVQGQATVNVGSQTLSCPTAGGVVTIPGNLGELTCPASDVLCNIAPCKNLCSGYGSCQRSGCACEKGHSGSDCSITCDLSCDQCSGSGSQACTSCRPGASLSNGACVCNQGLTMNAAGYCATALSCHATCLTCSGALTTQCTSCQYPARVGTSGACECPEGSALSATGNCVDCSSMCKTCAATSLSVCLSCYGDTVLNNGVCTCSTGNYFDSELYYCQPCETSCSTCSGDVENCISCPNGQVLSDGKCACSIGYFISGNSCSQCHPNCLSCSDSTEKGCFSCRSEAYLLSIPGPCLCRPSSTANCSPCLPQCQTCDGPGLLTCASCFSNAGVNPFTKLCKCNDGYYLSPDETNCVVCHPLCRTCFGGSSKECFTCSENAYIYRNVCSCSSYGYYFDQTLRMCKSCPENCAGCLGMKCSWCKYGFSMDANGVCVLQNGYCLDSLNQAFPYPNLCKHCTIQANPFAMVCTECYGSMVFNATANACQCASGNYYESALQQCVSCSDSKCLQCTSSGNCQLCEAPFVTQSNTYLCGCSSGGYRSGTTCLPCHVHCRTCRGPTSGDCMSCFDNAYLSGDLVGICVCRSGSGQTLCDELVCDSTCATCSGTDYNDCLSCHLSGQLESGTCPCYPSLTVGSDCRHCPGSCLECNTSGGCVSCSHSKAYIPANRPGECVCRGYPDPTPANCSPCHFTCKECSGPAENQCTACGYAAALKSSGKCQCSGLYEIMSSGDCFISNALCEDAFCTKCKGLATNTNSGISYNGLTFPTCSCWIPRSSSLLSLNAVGNSGSGMCFACGLLCDDCSLVTNMCSSCRAHSTLVILAPALNMGYCECQWGYYERNGECSRCGEGCVSCSSLSKCNKCVVGYELKVSGQQSTCQAFKPMNGCAQGLYLLRQTGLCEAICPTGFTPANGECNESSQTRFVWQFDQFATQFNDSSGNYTLSLGSSDAYPVYKRGLHVVSNSTYLYDDPTKLVLAPTFYIEVWLRGVYIGFGRGSPLSYFSFNENSLASWDSNFQLIDVSGNYYSTYPSSSATYSSNPPPPSEWRRIRLELITTTEGRDIITKYRLSKNDQIIGESIIRNYYFRDGPMDAVSGNLFIYFSYVGLETYLAEFTVANRLWKAEANACGYPLCTSNGFCLSNCAFNQYPSESSCLPCSASCTKGCLRGTDCGLNFDPLCTKFSNFTSCQGCHSLAERKGGVCSCQARAKFLSSNSTCVCDDDSKLSSSGFCAKCLNYLRADDVSVDIDESFMSLTLTFKKPMAIASGNCNDLFSSETVSKFGVGETCSWTPNRKQLTVLFGSEASLVVEEVELSHEAFLSTEGPCSFDAVKLKPKAGYKGIMPMPVPVLTAPTMVALACGVSKRPPVVSAQETKGGKGRKLQFKWTFQHSSLGLVFTTRANYSDESSITPAFEALSAGNLTVTLTVRNSFQQEASASRVIMLTDTRALSVQFESGPQLTLTSQDQGQVRVLVTESCGVNTAAKYFQWNFLSVFPALVPSDPDPNLVLQASNSPSALYIKKNSLAAGHSYIFQAVVTQGTVQGSASLNITVAQSSLVARLNRMSGSHPSDMTLRLDGSLSYDPDKSPNQISYNWACVDGADVCKDGLGAVLVQKTDVDLQLFQPERLRQGAVYNFTLTISKDSRKTSIVITMTIVAPTGCNIAITPFRGVINSGYPMSIVAAISADLEVDFLWRQTGGPTTPPTGPLTFAYISFRADSLQGGQNYGFELTAKTSKGNIIAAFEFYINRGPVGGKTLVTPSTGRALLDQFMLSTEGWEDAEGNYPLYYQFCLSKNSSTPVCVGTYSLKLWTYMKLYPGDLTVTANVFDYYGAKSQSTAQVTVSTAARRQLQDLTTSFQADIEDPENTCGMIVVYCQSIQATESLYTLMLSSLKAYIQSLNQMDLKSMESVLGAVEALAGEPPAQQSNQATALLSILKSTVSNCADSLTLSSILKGLSIISTVSNSTSDATRLEAADTASAIIALFNAQRLPNEAPALYSSRLLSSYAARATGGLLGSVALSLGNNATIVAPMGWLNGTNVASTDIIDVYARTYLLNSSIAWVVDLVLQRVGSYASYNVALTSPSVLSLSKLAVPLNVTIPFTQFPANSTLECIALVGGSWTNSCQLLEVRNNSAVVSSSYITPLSVRAVLPPQDTIPPLPSLPNPSTSDCQLNPTPLSIACAAFLLGVAGLGLILLGKSDAPPEDPRQIENSAGDISAHAIIGNMSELEQNKPEIPDQQEIPRLQPPVSKPSSGLLEFHLLFSCIFQSRMRLRKLWTLVSTLEVETLVLGLCYSFWDDNGDYADSANGVFSSYSGEDLIYVAISLGIGGIYCGLLQVLRMHPVPSAVTTVLALGGVLYLNVEQCCYSEGGRWGEGLLWTLLLQLLVLETAKAGVRLLWTRRQVVAS